jgi:branched-chain amino acid transport system permease protein
MLSTSKTPVLFPIGAIPQGVLTVGPVRVLETSLVVIGAGLVCLGGTVLLFRRSDIGTAMRAIAQDQEAAELVGLPTGRIIRAGFAVAGALAGVGGMLLGMFVGSLKWSDGLLLGIKGFAAALIGGLGSLIGVGLGAVVLAVGEIFGVGIRLGTFQLDNSWRDTTAFLIVIVVFLLRPEGILRRGARTWQVRN